MKNAQDYKIIKSTKEWYVQLFTFYMMPFDPFLSPFYKNRIETSLTKNVI